MLFVAVFFALAAGIFAQAADTLSPDLALLAKVRSRMVWNLRRQPNYTCVETVERSHRESPARPFKSIDTLRLEVALVDGKEMFGWPGSKNFEDTDPRNIVSAGAFGNGNFANHARAIFEGGFTRFTYKGDEAIGGKSAIRFDYAIPLLGSGYLLSVGDREATVAYHGSIYADPKTLDIERIDVVADDIPAPLGLASASDRMDYARIRIGGGDFLLPQESELTMLDAGGAENRNLVRFASCREFAGHSELTFADAAPPEPAPSSQIELPRNTGMELRLAEDVDIRTAAVGDPVNAVLESDIRQKGHALFARGANVLGRIARLERHDGYVIVGFVFSEIEAAGVHAAVKLKLEDVAGGEFLSPQARRPIPVARPGEGIIPLGQGHFRLNRGMLMFWRTNS